MKLEVREYGHNGAPVVVVLHGGPGARGYMAPVGRELASDFHVLEPLQRLASEGDATVAGHIRDLHEIIAEFHGAPPAILGSSWGAMLALAYAAEHPEAVGPLVLVGCGTFDTAARAVFTEEEKQRLDALAAVDATIDRESPEVLLEAYSFDLLTREQEIEQVDWAGMSQSWADMVRLQDEGAYPRTFAAIKSPVLMLHGSHDPLPGSLIRDSLQPFLANLEYIELAQCGHYPWMERHARDQFFEVVTAWLRKESSSRL